MELQDWNAVIAIIVGVLVIIGFTNRKIDDLDQKIDHKIDKVRGEFRDDMRTGFGEIKARLSVLEQRTYDISHLPPSAND